MKPRHTAAARHANRPSGSSSAPAVSVPAILPIAVAALLASLPFSAWATCTPQPGPLAFGSYDFLNSRPNDTSATISLTCGIGDSYTLSLSWGNSGGANGERWMVNQTNTSIVLRYSLYTDVAGGTLWTDLTTIGGTATSQTVQIPMYGRITQGQNVPAGAYTDTIIVTVVF